MTALYLERYMNFGLKREELQAGKPIIGIAQSGSDLSPCNRHHLELAERVREGIREAGGIAFEFPVHPIQETGKRPTASLDRNLAYLGLVEILYGYFIDGVVLTTGCDKTTPSQLMAAATVDIPAIVLSGGPMLNGWFRGERTGSGTIVWKARQLLSGRRNQSRAVHRAGRVLRAFGRPLQHHGHGAHHELAGRSARHVAARAAPRSPPRTGSAPQNAYETGKRIVEMVWEDLRPSKIMTREAFENVIVVNSAIGGSTNAPIHINAIARHIGVKLDNDDWEKIGYEIPLLVNLQPAGEYLGEEYHRAGGVPAVVNELLKAGKIRKNALTVNGKTLAENCKDRPVLDNDVIWPYKHPLKDKAGFLNLKGNLFDSAIMKTSVISDAVPRALSFQSEGSQCVRRPRHRVRWAGGLPSSHRRSETSRSMTTCLLFVRGAGPRGLSRGGRSGEHAAARGLIKQGVTELPCIGDGRQSGTSGSPSILNASPEAATGGGLAHPEDRRPRAHRPEQAHRRHPDQQGGICAAAGRARAAWRLLQDPGPPDALAGNPARHGR